MTPASNTPSDARRVFERLLTRLTKACEDNGERAVTLHLLRILVADALEELERA